MGADSLDIFRVFMFLIGLILYLFVSVILGLFASAGYTFSIANCTIPEVLLGTDGEPLDEFIKNNFDTCKKSVRVYSLVQLIGGAGLSVFLLLLVTPAYQEMKRSRIVQTELT